MSPECNGVDSRPACLTANALGNSGGWALTVPCTNWHHYKQLCLQLLRVIIMRFLTPHVFTSNTTKLKVKVTEAVVQKQIDTQHQWGYGFIAASHIHVELVEWRSGSTSCLPSNRPVSTGSTLLITNNYAKGPSNPHTTTIMMQRGYRNVRKNFSFPSSFRWLERISVLLTSKVSLRRNVCFDAALAETNAPYLIRKQQNDVCRCVATFH